MEENQNLDELSQIQYDDDNFESGTVEAGERYSGIKDNTVLLNPTTGEMVDINSLTPFERIKYVSNKEGKTINEPKHNCKHCHGRGYTYIDADDGIPTPCKCIFRDFYKQNPHFNVEMPAYNRKVRRAMIRQSKTKQLPNPALEKRQKRMNDLMVKRIREILAANAEETDIVEAETPEVVSEIVEQEVKETAE